MECCNAILEFEEKKFVCCELDNGHKGKHQALMFQWDDEHEHWDDSYWFRGGLLLKMKMLRTINQDKLN